VNDFLAQHAEILISLVKIAILLFVVLTVNAYLTWFERKVVAHIQSRWGTASRRPARPATAARRRTEIPFQRRSHSGGRR